MDHPQTIEVLVRRVAREVRVRRAEHWGLRGAFWGALVAAAVLVFKAALGLAALAVAPALVALGAIAGTTYGFTKRVIVQDVARLADRAFGLADRVATVLEWADRPDRTPLVDALVADTAARGRGSTLGEPRGHRAVEPAARLQQLPEEGRRAAQAAGAGG